MKIYLTLVVLTMLTYTNALTQEDRTYTTNRIDANQLTIDGSLDESIWNELEWQSDFTQFSPFEGRQPNQQTSYAIGYDDNFLFIGIKAFDSSPDSIVQRLTRRDDIDGDFAGLQIDSYHDQRTSFCFLVSSAGVKRDYIVSNDGDNEDESWNPNWWVKTSKDHQGWYVEMKIPFTQLRFSQEDNSNWGIQVMRNLFRSDEMSLWQPASRTLNGWVSQYGIMDGIKNINAKRSFEITPYFVARTDRFEKNQDDPFLRDGHLNKLNAGIDGKIGLSNNFTLDFSINPDFGQVEADPSQVNLSTQELFFAEQRPLFVEGKNILSLPLLFGDGDLGVENLFYSRRIGRSPQYFPDLGVHEYSNRDKFTNILGAAKLTGKTQNGWSFGLLESVAGEEKATIQTSDGDDRNVTIEPLTNYAVSRIQKDINEGNTTIGAIVSSVNRKIDQPHLEFLANSALTGGIDLNHKWKDRTYQFTFTNYFSKVQGTSEAIERKQRSFVRNYQRPDQDHKELDSTRTELTGFGGKAIFAKLSGNLNFMTALSWKSPGLELNDIGFMPESDQVFQVVWVGYRINEPFSIFRRIGFNFNQWTVWSFGGEKLGPGGNINIFSQLKNRWSIGGSYNINGAQIQTAALRGGPSLLVPKVSHQYFWLSTSEQNKLNASVSVSSSRSKEESYQKRNSINLRFNYQPTKSLKASLSTNYSTNAKELQYVTQQETEKSTKYIFGSIDQKVLSFSLRLNYNLTPDLSIQFWGQPFVASGTYEQFKYMTNPKAEEYIDRFHTYSSNQINLESDNYSVIENDGSYGFDNPDFNVKEFLSNLVIRWEYRPGSTIFAVWSQSRSNYINNGQFDFNNDLDELFNVPAYNVFLLKFAHRLGR